jgi:hypothetical protein
VQPEREASPVDIFMLTGEAENSIDFIGWLV